MKKSYISPITDIIIYFPFHHLLAGSVDGIKTEGNLPNITRGEGDDGDGGGDPGSFTNKGLWDEE